MKKILLFAIMAMFAIGSQAQIISSRSTGITKVQSPRSHNIWIDLGTGVFTGDLEEGSGVGIDLGGRWTKMFSENVGWDILKINAMTDTKNFGESLNVQFKTGLRGVTPVLFGNSSAYVAAAAGYGLFTDEAESAFVWEVGAGLNVTPRFAVGVYYNGISWSREMKVTYVSGYNTKYGYPYYSTKKEDVTIKGGYLSLKLSYAF